MGIGIEKTEEGCFGRADVFIYAESSKGLIKAAVTVIE
jgi:hypothetical protein